MGNQDVGRKWRQITALIGVLFIVAMSLCGIFTGRAQRNLDAALTAMKPEGENRPVVVIDAGHGGEDGGASTTDGVKESDINLEIATRLNDILNLFGVETLMTRTEDVSIYSSDALTLRQKKTSDLKNRVALVNEQTSAFLVSIHQNCFGSSKYSGAQVFYSASDPDGAAVAVYTQEYLRLALDPSNTRQAAVISDSVYLMKHISHSGILVECGFLSNAQEAERLQETAYQLDVAKAIAASLLEYGNI